MSDKEPIIFGEQPNVCIGIMGPATTARNFLFGCLRFVARDENGMPCEGEPIPYNQEWDDRVPVAFEIPEDGSWWGTGAGKLWNVIVGLPHCDIALDDLQSKLRFTKDLLRAVCQAENDAGYRLALVAAVQWLAQEEEDEND